MKDTLFQDDAFGGGFAFDQRVAKVFDDMAHRSIPGYATIQLLVADLAGDIQSSKKSFCLSRH